MSRVTAAVLAVASCTSSSEPTTKEQLGKTIFSDVNLSEPSGQACADCHATNQAFRDPESDHTSSMGVIVGRFGVRNAPTAMYARFTPELHFDVPNQRWLGGLFWDGRAGSLEEQAEGPLLNPLEMANPDKAAVVEHVRASSYAHAFRKLYGAHALDDVDTGFAHVTEALAAYERTSELAPFSSKYDGYLAGKETLTAQEQHGLAIFEDPKRGNCASCHPSRPSADGTPPLFTDFSYANLGIPRYQNNMFYRLPATLNPEGDRYTDHGLASIVGDSTQDGKFRVPTLRNITRTAPYGHNGYFANLDYMIDFLNTRDVGSRSVATCSRAGAGARCAWPPPEVTATLDHHVGNLGLSEQDVADLVAFLDTLSDRSK
jgi:cytochrome c peroxidase